MKPGNLSKSRSFSISHSIGQYISFRRYKSAYVRTSESIVVCDALEIVIKSNSIPKSRPTAKIAAPALFADVRDVYSPIRLASSLASLIPLELS